MDQARSAIRLSGIFFGVIGIGWMAIWAAPVHAGTCTDAMAKATLRGAVEQECPCASATDRSAYLRCAKTVIAMAQSSQQVSGACAGAVKQCITRSTCGRPVGWVTCCRTTAAGRTKCSVKPSAAKCTAPSGGSSACSTGFASCCDACTANGCAPAYTPTPTLTATATDTPTITSTPTATPTIPALCQSVLGLPTIAQVPFKITQGSTQCGGVGLSSPPPAAPFSGSVADASSATIGDLSLGCLYTGAFPGLVIPNGAVSTLSVVGVNLVPPSVTLGGSAGHGPSDCTLGAGPGRKCVDSSPGLDNMGTCNTDADCVDSGYPGVCQLEAHCFFGPPIPVSDGAASSCVVNAFLTDLCGSVDLVPPQANLATALSSRVYFSGHPNEPCPLCVSGVCDSGDHAGQSCTAVGTAQTSVDCPPAAIHFLGALTVVLPNLTTGTSNLSVADGLFCPDQAGPGAFGIPDVRSITEVGVPPGGSTNALAMDLAGTFCVPATGSPIDFFAGLPAAGGLSTAGQLDLSGVLP